MQSTAEADWIEKTSILLPLQDVLFHADGNWGEVLGNIWGKEHPQFA